MTRYSASYTILRYIPSILREEFVNVGVILICPEMKFQGVRVLPSFGDDSKLRVFEEADGTFIRHAVGKLQRAIEDRSINEVLGDNNEQALLSLVDLKNLQGMYVANNLQLSPVRSAGTSNPQETLEKLFADFVGHSETEKASKTVTRQAIRDKAKKIFAQEGLFKMGLQQEWQLPTLTAPTIDFAYQNGVWRCWQAISFAVAERTVKTTVDAYRQAANDARQQGKTREIKEAKFGVLSYVPKNVNVKTKNLLDVLKYDSIEIQDYRDMAQLAKPIMEDLKPHLVA
jgi:Protein of unknown function (DUF3037)